MTHLDTLRTLAEEADALAAQLRRMAEQECRDGTALATTTEAAAQRQAAKAAALRAAIAALELVALAERAEAFDVDAYRPFYPDAPIVACVSDDADDRTPTASGDTNKAARTTLAGRLVATALALVQK